MSGHPSNRGRQPSRGRGERLLPFHPRGGGAGSRGGSKGGGRGSASPFRGTCGSPDTFRGRRGGFSSGGAPPVEVFRDDDGSVPSPNPIVERTENELAVSRKNKARSQEYPYRPGYGAKGRNVTLWANYFALRTGKDSELYRYNVTLTGSRGVPPKGKKAERVIQQLIDEFLAPIGYDVATDFKSTLISPKKLVLPSNTYVVIYRQEEEAIPNEKATQYTCSIESNGSVSLAELIDYVTSSNAGSIHASKDKIIRYLNIIISYHPRRDPLVMTTDSNRHFGVCTNAQMMPLDTGLQAIRGIIMSVRAATARVLVNVQVTNMAFYETKALDEIMRDFLSRNRDDKDFLKLRIFLKKVVIDATHLGQGTAQARRVPRIKTITGFATVQDGVDGDDPSRRPRVAHNNAGAKDVKFYLHDSAKKGRNAVKIGPTPPRGDEYISIFDYFKEAHGITIEDPDLPVVNVGTTKTPSYLPAQVCSVRPGQPAKGKLIHSNTQKMIKFAVRQPAANARSLVASGRQLGGFAPTNSTLGAFDIEVPPKLITVPGRVLNAPSIKYSNNDSKIPYFGSWDSRSSKFISAPTVTWTYIYFSFPDRNPWVNQAGFENSIAQLRTTLHKCGVVTDHLVKGLKVNMDPYSTSAKQCEEIDKSLGKFNNITPRPRLLLVVLPQGALPALYNRVKYRCDISGGILNVCVIDKKFAQADDRYLANVCLKFNLKLGGRNHSLDPSGLGIIAQGKTMVVGYDVTHPSEKSASDTPSVAGIVASIDSSLVQWPAQIRAQPARREMVSHLEEMFKSRLGLWKKVNKSLPENILVYRDGVSESQYGDVLTKELPAMRAACRSLYPAPDTKANKPRITIVIVGKRHKTRFYPTGFTDGDRKGNPCSGTVVDRGITESRNWDFFLQSHSAVQGTARPAHYYVIYDQIFIEKQAQARFSNAAEALEDLTHNMCYLFGRATKAVSICPPVYYADLACTRARCYLSDLGTNPTVQALLSRSKIHEAIEDKMFYI